MMTSQGSHTTWFDGQEAHMTILSSRIHLYFKTSIPTLVNMNACWRFSFQMFPFVIGEDKWAEGQAIDHEEQIFNDALTSPHVLSEHTIGMWKG